MKTAQSDQSCLLETLEDRQLFSAFGTMNVIDAGVSPSVITSYTLNGVKDYADAGVANWTRSAVNPGTFAGSPKSGQTFGTFCLEPDQEFPSGANVAYTVTDLESDAASGGAVKANAIRELWGRFRSTIGTDGTKAAAFQMAIWEIVTDTGRDLSSGVFRAGTSNATEVAVKNQAQSWLNQLNGTGPKANLLALSSPTDQDQVFEGTIPCPPPPPPPTCHHTPPVCEPPKKCPPPPPPPAHSCHHTPPKCEPPKETPKHKCHVPPVENPKPCKHKAQHDCKK